MSEVMVPGCTFSLKVVFVWPLRNLKSSYRGGIRAVPEGRTERGTTFC